MTFAFDITSKTPLPPGDKRASAGPLYLLTGTFTNSSGGTGGAIITGGQAIRSFNPVDENAAPAVIVVARSGGTATITTTADHSGTWIAVVKFKK